MSKRKNSESTPSATSSPESADGHSPSDLQDGQRMLLFGPEVAPASPSRPRASKKPKPTNDTSGPISFGSSASAILQSCLVNRLLQRFGTDGSMEYVETWKMRATPAGRQYWEHTARALRISDSDYSGWPTCTVQDSATARNATANRTNPESAHHAGTTLVDAADLAGWGTPIAPFAGWATPANRDYRYPNAKSYQERSDSTKGEQLNNQVVHGATFTSSTAATARRGVLAPEFSRWLMGFPDAWDAASPSYLAWWRVQELIASAG